MASGAFTLNRDSAGMDEKTFIHRSLRETKPGSRGAVSCADCKSIARDTEEIVRNGLKLIRLRFCLHRSELPLLQPSNLKDYLLSLLGGSSTTLFSLGGRLRCFPRRFAGWDDDGFPKLVRLSRVHRWELAHSCASLQRSLPASCHKHTPSAKGAWLKEALSNPPPSSPEFLNFCRRKVRKFFPLGWDQGRYLSSVQSFSPQNSARAESLDWGLRADAFWSDFAPHGSSSKAEFSRLALHGKYSPLSSSPFFTDALNPSARFHLRVKSIPTAGKTRVIGIPSYSYDLLGPLHRSIYGHMVNRKGSPFVHGSVTAKRVSDVCKGSVQTSVDLTNATDGLRLDVTEAILGVILSKAVTVPGLIKELACESLYPSVGKGKSISHGQMMGAYLSFPLLCLHSWCAALWAARSSKLRGMAVNGDDVLMSHDLPLGEYPDGYLLNKKKTMTASRAAELNSTVFLLSNKKWRVVNNLRRGGGKSDYAGFCHMASACSSAGPSWVSAFVRSRFGKRWNLGYRDLGLPLSHQLVYHRELRFFGEVTSVKPPAPLLSDRYRMVSSEPSDRDKIAFAIDLFDGGRDVASLEPFNPSRSQCRKTVPRRNPLLRRRVRGRYFHMPSYDPKVVKVPKEREWMVLSASRPLSQEPRESVVEESRCSASWRLGASLPEWTSEPLKIRDEILRLVALRKR